MAIVFLTFGDIFAKFIGLEFGRVKIFGKTLEGSVGFFISSLAVGWLWSQVIPFSINLLFLGALAATFTELLPIGISDNFAIPLISASAMRIVQIF